MLTLLLSSRSSTVHPRRPCHPLSLLLRCFLDSFTPISVVLVDELDQMITKKQDVVYNFFNWPHMPHSKLIVIAVANTMDLPERELSGKIRSRLGEIRDAFASSTVCVSRAELTLSSSSLVLSSPSALLQFSLFLFPPHPLLAPLPNRIQSPRLHPLQMGRALDDHYLASGSSGQGLEGQGIWEQGD